MTLRELFLLLIFILLCVLQLSENVQISLLQSTHVSICLETSCCFEIVADSLITKILIKWKGHEKLIPGIFR
jgi:hypothetical protein